MEKYKALTNYQLRNARHAHGWTQEELAKEIGTTPINISRWERGSTFPSADLLYRLCKAFGKTVEELGFLQEETKSIIEDKNEAKYSIESTTVQGVVIGNNSIITHTIHIPSQKDFLIIYHHIDQAWGEWISWQLEAAGYSIISQEWSTNTSLASRTVVEHDKTYIVSQIIIIISPNFFNELYADSEWATSFDADPTDIATSIRLVQVRECKNEIQGILQSFVCIDLVGQDEVNTRETLLKGLHRRQTKEDAPRFPVVKRRYHHDYDVVLSYAGDDHNYGKNLSEALRQRGILVLQDQRDMQSLQEQDFFQHIANFCEHKAPCCVLLLSRSYAATLQIDDNNTSQVHTLSRYNNHILLVCLDDTEIAGLFPSLTYLSWPPETAETIADAVMSKLDSVSHSPLPAPIVTSNWIQDSLVDQPPPGFTFRYMLRGHTKEINRLAWSPDGRMLASPSSNLTLLWDMNTGILYRTLEGSLAHCVAWSPDGKILASGSTDGVIQLWEVATGEPLTTYLGHTDTVYSLAWSPDGKMLASGSTDGVIQLWEVATGKSLTTYLGHTDTVYSLAWSPDGKMLASGSSDKTVRVWNLTSSRPPNVSHGHSSYVTMVAWSPNGELLASSSGDGSIRFWDSETGKELSSLEAHLNGVLCISFSCDSRLLASKSADGTIRLWRTDTLEMTALLKEFSSNRWNAGIAFHPSQSILATLDEGGLNVRIWDLDFAYLLGHSNTPTSIRYTNAKLVLVGDTGVGKSALGFALTKQPFVPLDSTHGRYVKVFDSQVTRVDEGYNEIHEILLWDLAGQPGYRVIHQLHLNSVAIALLVFDARSETDPFAGIYYWDRALRQVQRVQDENAIQMKKILIAARIDRGGISVSRERIDLLMSELSFDGYFETSAKEGWGIEDLTKVIQEAIDWNALPKVISTDLFQRIRAFLIGEREAQRLLATIDDLYYTFLAFEHLQPLEDLRAQFEICIGRVESQGLICRFSFGNFILLRPELLDAYASALVNAVRAEPDGFGSITEERARTGQFRMPEKERISDKEQEKLLLVAMIEDLLGHEIVLREATDDGPQLIFPSQSTREKPDLPDPEGKTIIFEFEGPVLNIYGTLAVRLSHSSVFKKQEIWKNAVTYTNATKEGVYGMFLSHHGEGHGKLTLFFSRETSEGMRFHFEQYVEAHLIRRSLPDSLHRRRVFVCSECETPFPDLNVTRRRKRGFSWIQCSVCETKVSLLDGEGRLSSAPPSLVPEMDRAADTQRVLGMTAFITQPIVKELIMGDKIHNKIGDISNISGQVFIGKFNDVIATLNNANQRELAEALTHLKNSVMVSQHIPEDEKREQVEVISDIGEEATKDKPNKKKLKGLVDILITTLKAVPDVAKAVTDIEPLLSHLHL